MLSVINNVNKVDMNDLSLLHYSLDIQVYLGDHGSFISQKNHMLDMLKKFIMLDNFYTHQHK